MSDTVDTGLLFVYGETGPNVTDEEFNDWYNNEHAPLRLLVPGISTALRYIATDALQPTYLALYDLASPSVATSPAYLGLKALASEREKGLVRRLEGLERRVYELISTTGPDGGGSGGVAATSGDGDGDGTSNTDTGSPYPTPYVLLASIRISSASITAEALNAWYADEHLALLAKVPGLVRIRRYKLVSSVQLAGSGSGSPPPSTSANSTGAQEKGAQENDENDKEKEETTNDFLTLFDVTRDDFDALPEFAASIDTEWSRAILPKLEARVIRRFKLHTVVQKPESEDGKEKEN